MENDLSNPINNLKKKLETFEFVTFDDNFVYVNLTQFCDSNIHYAILGRIINTLSLSVAIKPNIPNYFQNENDFYLKFLINPMWSE